LPERNRRTRRWFSLDAASSVVEEPRLALILFRLASLGPMRAETPLAIRPWPPEPAPLPMTILEPLCNEPGG
jgi:hypothetical protein